MISPLIFTIAIVILTIIIVLLAAWIIREKKQLRQIELIMDEISNDNLDRRILAKNGDSTANISYKLNEIVMLYKFKLIRASKIETDNKRMMTSLSHDIRTPLTSLIGYLDAIQDSVVEGEERDEYLAIVQTKAYDLKEYVDSLFEWFKLHSNERIFRFERIDVNELTRSILIDWIPQFEKYEFEFEANIADDQLMLDLDASAYQRILNNLIHNAVKHSEGTKITLSLTQNDTYVNITIEDNGRGISADNLPHIFDRLYKCDNSRSNFSNGLGLSILQELIQAHSGSITAESIPNVKTVFTVTLPRYPLENEKT